MSSRRGGNYLASNWGGDYVVGWRGSDSAVGRRGVDSVVGFVTLSISVLTFDPSGTFQNDITT